MISPTETEIIITSEECEVPQDYIETITREVPVLTWTNMTIEEPQKLVKTVTYEEPFVVTVSEPYDVPEIHYIDSFEEVPVEKVT